MILLQHIDKVIEIALNEDINYGDITTDTLIDSTHMSSGKLIAKEGGIIAGIDIFKRVFEVLDSNVEVILYKCDGDTVFKGEDIAKISGPTSAILKGERTALNLMQRLSGIATTTNKYVDKVKGTNTRIVDTRKTTPGLRALEKYAVTVGGGYNHRFNLSDAVMMKDNHIKAVGGIKEAISKARKIIPHTMKIEVEVESLEQLQEALEGKADIIMLDNMRTEIMKEAVRIAGDKAILEASGNMTLDKVEEVAKTGVDIISVGAITHSVKALDISLRLI